MPIQSSQALSLQGMELLWFSMIVTSATLLGWLVVFRVVQKKEETLGVLIAGGSFLQNLTVVGVVIATTCLGFVGVMRGELCATVFSGIAGYVLGSIKAKNSGAKGNEPDRSQPPRE